jgi:hypothetical protein
VRDQPQMDNQSTGGQQRHGGSVNVIP